MNKELKLVLKLCEALDISLEDLLSSSNFNAIYKLNPA